MAFEVITEGKINDSSAVSKAIWDKSLQYLGELGCAEAGIIILKDKYNNEKQRGLLRVNNRHLDKVRAALTMVEEVEGKKAIMKSVGVSGILCKASRYLE